MLRENQERCDPPLPESEVSTIAASVSRYAPKTTGGTVSLAKLREFSSINPEPLRWLWSGRIPLGKLTLIAGDPGLGKSLLMVDIAARVSTGTPFPDGAASEQGTVIFLSAEDDPGDTIRPRLDAAGADISRIHLLEAVRSFTSDGKSVEGAFSLERDIDALEEAISRTRAGLVIIDPISAYLGATDSHNNSQVRGLLAPLAALAAKYKATMVLITHLRKGSGLALYRFVESIAFGATARSAWGVVADPDDKAQRLLLPVKQNLGPDAGGLAYKIEAPEGLARIAWERGAVAVDVNAVMGGFDTREYRCERREAAEWLREFLAHGPRAVPEIKRESAAAGLSWMTLRRAADSLGVTKRKSGFGTGWEWAEDGQQPQSEVSIFENGHENKGDKPHDSVEDAQGSISEPLDRVSTFTDNDEEVL